MPNTPSDGKHSRIHIASIFWGVLCLFLMLSCAGRHSYPADLSMADSLCRTNPDSAVAYIKALSKKYANSSDGYDRNYYLLLTVKAANNAYKPLKDSTIFRVMDFYEKANDTEKLCQSYYYVGKHLVQENDAPQALKYFQKSLDLTDEKTPVYFKSCLYNQSGQLFEKQEMYDDALQMYKQSYTCDSLLRDTVNMIYSMTDIAVLYNFKRKYRTGVSILEKAYSLSKGVDDVILQKSLTQSLAAAYFNVNNQKRAKLFLDKTLQGVIPEIESPAYAIAIDIYNKENNVDSVIYYSNLLLRKGTIYAKQKAARNLLKYYSSKNDVRTAAKYLNMYVAFSDSVNKINAVDKVAKMHYTYNYNLRENENKLLKSEATISRLTIVAVSLSGILIVLLCIYLLQKSRMKLLRYIHLNEQLERLRAEAIRNGEKEVKNMEKELSLLQDEINRLNERHYNEKAKYEDMKRLVDKIKKNMSETYEESDNTALTNNTVLDVYTLIKKRLDNKKNLCAADWDKIKAAIDIAYPHFKAKLYGMYTLKEDEYQICMLIKIGFMNSDISTLMNKSDSAITQKRSKMYSAIFSQKGSPKDFNIFVKSL